MERFDDSELDVSADLGVLTVGGNQMTVRADGYRVVIDLPGHDIRGELDLTSVSRPFAVNNQPVGDGRVSWLFVPRLRADGWVQIGRPEIRFENNVAYHDHNWEPFPGAETSAGRGVRSFLPDLMTHGRWFSSR